MNIERWKGWLADPRWWVSVAVAAVSACDNTMNDGECGAQVAGTADLGVWWGGNAGGKKDCKTLVAGQDPPQPANAEQEALSALQERYWQCNKQVSTSVRSYGNRAELVEAMDKLVRPPDKLEKRECGLPDVVQLNAGDTALKYSPCVVGERGILAPIPPWLVGSWDSTVSDEQRRRGARFGGAWERGAVITENRPLSPYWDSTSGPPPPDHKVVADHQRWIRRFISCGGEYWMTPIAVHQVNKLFYNVEKVNTVFGKEFLAALSDMPMEDWISKMEAKATVLNDASMLAIPNERDSRWALSLLAAENVQVALRDGMEPMQEKANVSDENVEAIAETAQRDADFDFAVAERVMETMVGLLALAQKSPEPITVTQAMERVENGDALFTVMGDWAYPEVDPNKVGMVTFPGTQNTLVYTIDGFVAIDKGETKSARQPTPQAEAWMNVVSQWDTASSFAITKGATSIHSWVDRVQKCANEAAELSRDCMVIPALSMTERPCKIEDAMYEWVFRDNEQTFGKALHHLADCSEYQPELIDELQGGPRQGGDFPPVP